METTMQPRYFALHDRMMVLHDDDQPLTAADLQRLAAECAVSDHFTERLTAIEAIALPAETALPKGFHWTTIRSQFHSSDATATLQLSRAKALVEWRSATRFCSHCGAQLADHAELTARVCTECGKVVFPRIEPCVIVLVNRGDEILLARHVQRNQDIYACIAGFIEAGESAEHAVAREVLEETGIEVKNIRFYASQSWPFPSQLMLGFTAEYASGELRLQEDEIADAGWFRRDACPATPAPGSLAYRLIHQL